MIVLIQFAYAVASRYCFCWCLCTFSFATCYLIGALCTFAVLVQTQKAKMIAPQFMLSSNCRMLASYERHLRKSAVTDQFLWLPSRSQAINVPHAGRLERLKSCLSGIKEFF